MMSLPDKEEGGDPAEVNGGVTGPDSWIGAS